MKTAKDGEQVIVAVLNATPTYSSAMTVKNIAELNAMFVKNKKRNTMKTRLSTKGNRAIMRVAYETPIGEYLVIDIVDEFLIILN